MPRAPKRPCRNARKGCAALVEGGGFCAACKPNAHAQDRAARGSASERGYDYEWSKLSERVKDEEPLCRRCDARGIVKATQVTDHIVPKRYGGTDDRSNLQGLCYSCNTQKAVEDKAKYE